MNETQQAVLQDIYAGAQNAGFQIVGISEIEVTPNEGPAGGDRYTLTIRVSESGALIPRRGDTDQAASQLLRLEVIPHLMSDSDYDGHVKWRAYARTVDVDKCRIVDATSSGPSDQQVEDLIGDRPAHEYLDDPEFMDETLALEADTAGEAARQALDQITLGPARQPVATTAATPRTPDSGNAPPPTGSEGRGPRSPWLTFGIPIGVILIGPILALSFCSGSGSDDSAATSTTEETETDPTPTPTQPQSEETPTTEPAPPDEEPEPTTTPPPPPPAAPDLVTIGRMGLAPGTGADMSGANSFDAFFHLLFVTDDTLATLMTLDAQEDLAEEARRALESQGHGEPVAAVQVTQYQGDPEATDPPEQTSFGAVIGIDPTTFLAVAAGGDGSNFTEVNVFRFTLCEPLPDCVGSTLNGVNLGGSVDLDIAQAVDDAIRALNEGDGPFLDSYAWALSISGPLVPVDDPAGGE